MNLRVVLVEPEYEGNIGFTARVMKNFNASDLFLVNPKSELGLEAKTRSMKAFDILSKAKKAGSITEAVKGTDFIVGFTAKFTKKKGLHRTVQSLQEFSENYSSANKKISLVFGTEKNGLSNEQLNECDLLVSIPTSVKYPAMNLSHSVAVVLYALNSAEKKHVFVPIIDSNLKEQLISEFTELIYSGEKIRQKQKTLNAFKAFISRVPARESEAKAILSVFKSANKALKRK
ncbi:MAG: TrmJ/YjtD family RNA methyltransferase [Candidatus Diapherotrites archaeon]|nr:TrmJ/YjtD family RNA methyltransferase [Candidatus Diapherotrites archaeon]